MSDRMKERIEGAGDEIAGKAREAWGDLTRNQQTQAKGEMDVLKGKAKEMEADAEKQIDEAIDRLGE